MIPKRQLGKTLHYDPGQSVFPSPVLILGLLSLFNSSSKTASH